MRKQINANELPHRKILRLSKYNYSKPGYYFVTICSHHRICALGKISCRKIFLSNLGKIVKQNWQLIPKKFNWVEIDEFTVMPNHLHGILIIRNVGAIFKSPNLTGEINFAPTINKPTLSDIIKWFKSITTITIKRQYNYYLHWQRSYYDHIIRNEISLHKIREYIRYNHLKWNSDIENPKNQWQPDYYEKLFE